MLKELKVALFLVKVSSFHSQTNIAMKNYTNFIFISFMSLLWGCKSEQPSNSVRINVHSAGSKGQTLAVKSVNMLTKEQVTLAETKFDSTGNASLGFEISNTQFATVHMGEKSNSVLLNPGCDLDITFDLNNAASNPIFKGKAAEASRYLNVSNAVFRKFEFSGGKYFYELDTLAFAKRYDSLSNAYSNLHKAFLDTTKASEEICSLLDNNNKLLLL